VTRTKRYRGRERWSGGQPADCGAAACRALPGGSPTGAAPRAGQLARTRRQVAQAPTLPRDRAGVSDRAVLLAPGILSPSKDHRQGRTSSLRCGRSTDLPRQDLGTYQEDGPDSTRPLAPAVADAMARAPDWWPGLAAHIRAEGTLGS
jgi:hypothetical protein